jgi:subtilisin family serine protease
VYVIPDDALPLLAADKVDRRLFDVTLLIEHEYDDAHRDNLPFIVTYGQSVARRSAATVRSVAGTVVGTDLPSINGLSVTSSKARLHEVWGSVAASPVATSPSARSAAPTSSLSEPIQKIWLDGLLRPSLDQSVAQMGAPAAWELGYEGDGVVVAVLDTGVDDTHLDLIDSVVASRNFTVDSDFDEVGHGTHVASIIAGSGAAEGARYRGVAPGVQLLSGKVCEGLRCPESSIIAGMQWAVMEEGARVVNMSIGGDDLPGLDPMEEAVNTLSAEYGALFVIAAGNSGPGAQSINTPGSADAALTVGAVYRDERLAEFSSRGLRIGDFAIKPDLTAPGVDIVAARAAGTELGTPVGEEYVAVSGTSMATPHAAGVAALLLQQNPEWGPEELKAALMGSARFNPLFTALDQGTGRVDVVAALSTSLMADTPSVSFGRTLWPHEDDEPVTRTVIYRNLGPATELVLELDMLGPEGLRPPAEMFTVTPAILSLEEGATASVVITANTKVPVPDGVYSGRLIASDGVSRAVSVPLAVDREVESYDLVLRHIDRQGAPADSYVSRLVRLDAPIFFEFFIDPPSEPGDVTLRLPAGRYALEAMFYDPEGLKPLTILAAPNQLLSGSRLLSLDARVASPMTVTTPKPEARNVFSSLTWQVVTPNGGLVSVLFLGETAPLYYSATLGPTPPEFLSVLHAQWIDSSATPPALYAGTWVGRDGLPEGPVKAIKPRKMATVHASYAASLPASQLVNELSVVSHVEGIDYAVPTVFPELPMRRTEYYYSDDKAVSWLPELWMHNEEYSQSIILGWVTYDYHAGRTYTSRWNEPTFSPSLPENSTLGTPAYREGDLISVFPAMYADRGGHAGFIANEGRTVLYRNGEIVGESESGLGGSFEVPPEPASYRLELDLAQTMFELTTRERVVWTFDSAHAPDGEERLPLLTVRFDPALSERGEAPRGKQFRLPFSVAQFGEKGEPHVGKPTLEVSYDDGQTWAGVPVEKDGARWNALLDHPRRAEYVSLRASAHDRRGNGVEQTLIRAYGLAGRH